MLQNKASIEIIGFQLSNAFWVRLRFVRYRIVKYRVVRYIFRSVRYRYHQQIFCLSPRRLQDMSSRRCEDVFSVTIFRLPRRLARCLQDVFIKTKNLYAEDVLKTNKYFLGSASFSYLHICLRL